ncbi:MAG: ATP-binding cassette domain-containing protein [Acidaminococcales bacterium]|nr:ATP-binding cassette domain-containing protein [Acidaminococcales bacterium]
MEGNLLVSAKNIKKYFPIRSTGFFARNLGYVKAVDGVSFDLYKGDTLGIVGESGCGKSTMGRLLVNLLEPTEGEVIFDWQSLSALNKQEMRKMRRRMQFVFQDPYASLNPRMTVGAALQEPLIIHGIGNSAEHWETIAALLATVGLDRRHADYYPHEFSGGQRQRIAIARALVTHPDLIVADEAVSALDVSIQAQILNLLQDLQQEFALTYLFISHDLSVIKRVSNKVGVMYLGRMMEFADKKELFANPLHPYTQALLAAAPSLRPGGKNKIILEGDAAGVSAPLAGCVFHTRCPRRASVCAKESPELAGADGGHKVACHFA